MNRQSFNKVTCPFKYIARKREYHTGIRLGEREQGKGGGESATYLGMTSDGHDKAVGDGEKDFKSFWED